MILRGLGPFLYRQLVDAYDFELVEAWPIGDGSLGVLLLTIAQDPIAALPQLVRDGIEAGCISVDVSDEARDRARMRAARRRAEAAAK